MVEQSLWMQKVAANPGHSQWYIDRFRSMAQAGKEMVFAEHDKVKQFEKILTIIQEKAKAAL